MTTQNNWFQTAPQVIYEAYPDSDLLPIEPPKPGETIREFKVRAEDAADTLFLFLCREADDEIDAGEYLGRLDRAIRDIEAVRDAFQDASSPVSPLVPVRLALGEDWIELTLGETNAQGRRSGSIISSLHSSDADDEQFNAAMDAVESIVLAHACAGMNVTDPRYVEGIRTCVEACANNLPGGDE